MKNIIYSIHYQFKEDFLSLDILLYLPQYISETVFKDHRQIIQSAGIDLISYCYLSNRNPIFSKFLVAIISFSFILIEKLLIIILKNLRINIFDTIVIVNLLFLRYSQRLDTLWVIILFGFILLSVKSLLLNSNNYNYLNQP